jgi:hypothetical protein
MKKHELALIVVAGYAAVGLILYFLHDSKNVRFAAAFPSKTNYALTWPYWEFKALTQ